MAKKYTVRDFARTYTEVKLPNGHVVKFTNSLADVDAADVDYFRHTGGQFDIVEHEAGMEVAPIAGQAPVNSPVGHPDNPQASETAKQKQEDNIKVQAQE